MFLRDYFEALNAHKEHLLRQIAKAKEMKSLVIFEQQEHLRKRVQETKQANQFAENLLQNGTDTEVLVFIGILQNRFKFCQQSKFPIESNIPDIFQFQRNELAPSSQQYHNIPIYGVLTTPENLNCIE